MKERRGWRCNATPSETQRPADVNQTGRLRGRSIQLQPSAGNRPEGKAFRMGNTVRHRLGARAPQPPTETLGTRRGQGPAEESCPDRIVALLKGSAAATSAIGEQVAVQVVASGDLIVVHASYGPLGRLAGIEPRLRQCLSRESYVGLVAEGRGSGPEVLLSRVAQG